MIQSLRMIFWKASQENRTLGLEQLCYDLFLQKTVHSDLKRFHRVIPKIAKRSDVQFKVYVGLFLKTSQENRTLGIEELEPIYT